LNVINDGFGIKCVFATGGSVGQQFFTAVIDGTYDIVSFLFTLDPVSGSDVDVDDLITITSPGTDIFTDLDLSQLTIPMACGTVVPITQTQTLFTFRIPAACTGAGAVSIVATGNGVQFSGTITLGSLTILLTNASGIYTLVPGKTNDTLYDSARDGTTRNVRIPDPFAKTGFIGG